MSLVECTARSTVRIEQRLLDLLGEQALAALLASGRSWMVSPEVRMTTSSISSSLAPKAAASRARTVRACTSASGLPRVPIRKRAVDCAI